MRVLHLSTWNAPCGIATYCNNLVQALDAIGVHGDVYPLASHRWATFTPGDVLELQSDIATQARSYDLVHIQHEHGIFGHATSYKAAARNFGGVLRRLRQAGVPSVTTFHTAPLGDAPTAWPPSLGTFTRNWNRRSAWRGHVSRCFHAGRHDATAVVHTPVTRRSLVRLGMPSSTIRIIPHGCLPTRELRLDACTAKERLGLPADSVMVTIFGFVGGYKGHATAVRAMAQLPERFHLFICGGSHPESQDRTLASVIRLVKKLGVGHRVTITGWLPPDSAELHYAATDICLAPYLDPHLAASGAITWALASGKPIIGSKIPAFQEICREHPCMLLTTPGMVEEIAWAVEKIADDQSLADRLTTEARGYVHDNSWEQTAFLTSELYAGVVRGTPAAAPGLGHRGIVIRRPPALVHPVGRPSHEADHPVTRPRLAAG